MAVSFHLLLRCRTSTGFEEFARFYLGSNRQFAYNIFSELEGSTETTEADTLTMELMEIKAGLPFNLKIITCTLDQLADNCRLLTKEIFKETNLK